MERIKQEKVVLIIQDTSEINFSHRAKIEGMGLLAFECQQGFYLHPSLAITPERVCLGVVDGYRWIRDNLGGKVDRDQRPIEEKESYRWLESYTIADEIAHQCLETLVVTIADREGDIYELLMKCPGERGAHWLIRSAQNRCLLNDEKSKNRLGDKLWEKAKKATKLADIEFRLPQAPGRKERDVKQAVRATRVCLRPPDRKGKKLPAVEMTIVLCTEEQTCAGEEKLEWLLLTSLPINDAERADEIVQWYLCRWQIEVFFKILILLLG